MSENGPYWVRACRGHYHVACGDFDLTFGPYDDKHDAQVVVDALNNGATDVCTGPGTYATERER